MLRQLRNINDKCPLLILVLIHSAFLLSILLTYQKGSHELEKKSKCQEVISTSTTLSKSFYDAGLAIGAYGLTKNEMFADRYQKLSAQIPLTLAALVQSIKEQHNDKINATEIEKLVQQGVTQLANAKTFLDTNQISPFGSNNTEARSLYKQVKITADHLQNKLDELSQAELAISQNIPQQRLFIEALLVLTLVLYASYNLNIQYQLTKIISVIVHQKRVIG